MTAHSSQIRVAIAGVTGKMGREAVRALSTDNRFHLCAALVRNVGQAPQDLNCSVFTDPRALIVDTSPDVWLDLTDARSVVAHVDACIDHGVRPVVGATGYSSEDIQRWQSQCRSQQLGAVVAPNFAIGALLMMRFAGEAARYLNNVEIIELHHDGKRDAPSGTAKRTAQAIAESRQEAASVIRAEIGQTLEDMPSRGLMVDGVPVHSVRLPGFVAHQKVIFGGTGEVLTIQHDSMSRESFMPGVLLACAKVVEQKDMIYGLEHLLW